jgi:hypothetical protein
MSVLEEELMYQVDNVGVWPKNVIFGGGFGEQRRCRQYGA